MGFVGVRSNLNLITENWRTKWDAVHYVKVSDGQAWESTLSLLLSPDLASHARVMSRRRIKARSGQRSHDFEEAEFFEIGIGRVKSPYPVMPQNCGNERIGRQIHVNAGRLGHLRRVRSERSRFLNDVSLLSDLCLQEWVDGSNAAVVLTVVEVFG